MDAVLASLDYVAVTIVFCTGLYVLLVRQNLLKKLIGLNIMETAVFAFIVTTGMVDGADPPLLDAALGPVFASPLPHALVLTGIVVAVSVTSLALAMIARIQREHGTIELDELLARDGDK
ncbi:MAG: sodium:proton antiporter [Candidatus Wenzhouxiangella sp. M2_3B_020]